ncbi:MAG: hypothetical protein HGA96_14145 [Desulfobulbaceae bacterium]|nr:hypothetical protein [Desulfobulbaceae bacterium]
MNRTTRPAKHLGRLALLTCASLLFLAGCLPFDGSQDNGDSGHAAMTSPGGAPAMPSTEPYFPADFRDLLIPGELEWQRNKSVSINTESFTGGILNFSGRVEVNSLTEFFVNAMKKDQWTLIGSVKSENVLLAFTKEKSSCMIKIDDGGTLGKTAVNISITQKNN